jgi:hypothetical protein
MLDTSTSAGRSTRGRVPIYRPLLNGEDFDIQVSEATVSSTEYAHDQATIQATSVAYKDTSKFIGSNISFMYGLAPRTELFCGYIVNVQDSQGISAGGSLAFTLSILGPTKVMQGGSPRFWPNRTIPSAVQSLSYLNQLGFDSHDHNFLWESLAQTENTDWKTICALARKIGWIVFNRYGVVMLYDPLKLFTDNGNYIQLIASQYQNVSMVGEEKERALLEFNPQEDSVASLPNVGARIAYFNNGTVQTLQQQGEYELFHYLTNLVVRSREEAEIYIGTSDHDAGSWKQQATARALGNASIFPGMNVDIRTSNPAYWRDRYSGRWLVRGVQHKMDMQSFQTQLVLARPDNAAGVSMGNYSPFWTQVGKPKPSMILADGQWVSNWAERNARMIAL